MSLNYKKTKLACYIGFVVQAVINNFLPILFIALQDMYSLTYEELGRIILLNFVIQIIADMMAIKIVKKIGYRGAVILSQAGATVGLILLAILPNFVGNTYVAINIAVVVYAFSGGLMEVILSPMMEMLPVGNKSGNMAFLHSFYCWGQAFTILVTTLLISVLGFKNWNFIPLIWAIIPFLNMFNFIKVPIAEPDETKVSVTLKEFLKTREFRCFMILMLCAGASEIAMAEWASIFAQNALGVSKIVGDLAGPCAFALFMGLGRMLSAAFAGKFSMRKAIIGTSILCCICYIAAAISANPIIALLACALCGLSVSLFWPGTYSMASARFNGGNTLMFSVFALCGDTGCSFGPWLLGIIADNSSLRQGFLITTIFPILMLVTIFFFLKEKDCKTA